MAKLYEIRREIEEALESGDFERVEQLNLNFEEKLGSCAAYIRNLKSENEEICAEIKRLQERKRLTQNKIDENYRYIEMNLPKGDKLKIGTHHLSWRKSVAVDLIEGQQVSPEFLKVEYTPMIQAMKDYLETGKELPFARLVEKLNLQVK